ncbi:hypothetical protein DPMN_090061 [Dreissena polymorpha]|uniref:Uncharacterized protein n=1 Tax=Dreissena polymorpha TaxID=45954 RepID=A0A9D4KX16_DREPO|nr:hypothetical protein DPMN_090061 [Dreissena polymorpha]
MFYFLTDAVAAESDAFFAKPLDFFFSDAEDINSLTDVIPEAGPVEDIDIGGFSANEFIVCLDRPYTYSPDVVLEDFILSKLRESCEQALKSDKKFMYMTNSSNLKCIELYDSDEHWETPRVKTCISVDKDLAIKIMVQCKSLPDSHTIYRRIGSSCYSIKSIQKVFDIISDYHICEGNNDAELQDLIPVGSFMDITKGNKYQGYRDSFFQPVNDKIKEM